MDGKVPIETVCYDTDEDEELPQAQPRKPKAPRALPQTTEPTKPAPERGNVVPSASVVSVSENQHYGAVRPGIGYVPTVPYNPPPQPTSQTQTLPQPQKQEANGWTSWIYAAGGLALGMVFGVKVAGAVPNNLSQQQFDFRGRPI